MTMKLARFSVAGAAGASLGGCNRIQSTYHPFGVEADSILSLAWWLMGGGIVIAIAMLTLIVFAQRQPENSISHQQGMRFIAIVGGIVPAIVLTVLLVAALPMMKPLEAGGNPLIVEVQGEQFWWRIRYPDAPDGPVITANQLVLPVGRTAILKLTAGDVVHSFWVPGLGGKMDMIPGRENELVVRAEKAGVYRGQCTEFCGLSHALMAFEVRAVAPRDFERWLDEQRAPAQAIAGEGRELFADYGCAGCHRIDGHGADGTIGPDLTHFASRPYFGAQMFPLRAEALARFIRHSSDMKPGSRMPAFADMPVRDARLIADYLMEPE